MARLEGAGGPALTRRPRLARGTIVGEPHPRAQQAGGQHRDARRHAVPAMARISERRERAVRVDNAVVEDPAQVFAPGFEGMLAVGKRNFARVRLVPDA